jgi:ABC-type multidrug transport system ATPase subunit
VLGGTPRQDPAYLAEIGFLAQEGGGPAIVLSSHLIADTERVCDLILLAASRVQLCGDTETLLARHRS